MRLRNKSLYLGVTCLVVLAAVGCKSKPVPYADYYGHCGVVFTGDGMSGIDLDRRTGKVTWGKSITQAEIDEVQQMRRNLAAREEKLRLRRILQNNPEAE